MLAVSARHSEDNIMERSFISDRSCCLGRNICFLCVSALDNDGIGNMKLKVISEALHASCTLLHMQRPVSVPTFSFQLVDASHQDSLCPRQVLRQRKGIYFPVIADLSTALRAGFLVFRGHKL